MKIALTGNPNSGKTTMYNALTGKSGDVGNWAGVTVEKKEHNIKKMYNKTGSVITAVDLPGAYSMSPFTGEESVTSDYIHSNAPDVIINIVDATNLSRSLFFTTQLLELGVPVVVALNKSDINEKKGTEIDEKKLSEELFCPIVKTSADHPEKLGELISIAAAQVGTHQKAPYTQGNIDLTDREVVQKADRERFAFVNELVSRAEKRKVLTRERNFGDKLDDVLTNKWLGIPIFAVVMFLVFQISQVWVGKYVADMLTGAMEVFQEFVRDKLSGASPFLSALLVDGMIGGVIAVLGFLPLVMVMYFLIALLEDCGYMSRVAAVLDPIFKRVGLSGKSVIPFVITVGCAVPGIMASRTVRNDRERRITAMLAPFMPCGAKIPVIALFAGMFFDNAGWVSALMYFSGIVLIFTGAVLATKISGGKLRRSLFIIELPEYKVPSFRGAFMSMCGRGKEYIIKAATIILLCNTTVQIMQTFDWSLHIAESADTSILASIARPFAYILVPVTGILSWQLAAAAVTGFIAKENIVGTLAVCCVGLGNLVCTDSVPENAAGVVAITKTAALAYLMFNLYSPPCFAAIGAMNAEMKSRKWLWGGIGLQFSAGYTVSYLVYTVGTLLTAPEKLNIGATVGGGFAVIVIITVMGMLIHRTDSKTHSVKYKKELL